jgi:hypothetical protein
MVNQGAKTTQLRRRRKPATQVLLIAPKKRTTQKDLTAGTS